MIGVVLSRVKRFDEMPSAMNARADEVSKGVTKIVKTASRVIHRGVVVETPVDVGVARSNWIVTKNIPTRVIIPAYAPFSKFSGPHKGESGNKNAAIAQGRAPINAYVDGKDRRIIIQNNVGYIGALNRGTSIQTPREFVQRAFQKGIAAIRKLKVLEKA